MGAFKHLVNKRLSRRDFVRGSAMAGGALALGGMGTGLGAGSLKAEEALQRHRGRWSLGQ